MGAGDISGGASLWRPATSRYIAPSVNDPVDLFVTHFQRPSRRDIAPSVNATSSGRVLSAQVQTINKHRQYIS